MLQIATFAIGVRRARRDAAMRNVVCGSSRLRRICVWFLYGSCMLPVRSCTLFFVKGRLIHRRDAEFAERMRRE